jgi:Skp family chaperone for outer membrane proteins
MENLLDENKDKLPDEIKDEVNKLIIESKDLKSKEDVTKEELDTEIERLQKEFQDLYQKFQAETQNTG